MKHKNRKADGDVAQIQTSESDNLEDRVKKLELHILFVKWGAFVLALFGVTAGGLLWSGYQSLKDEAEKVKSQYESIQQDCALARQNVIDVKTESAKVMATSLEEYEKLAAANLELRKTALKANADALEAIELAGQLSVAVATATASSSKAEKAVEENARILNEIRKMGQEAPAIGSGVREAQRALEAYLAKRMPSQNVQRFIVEVTGFQAKCSFVTGESIPYQRRIAADYSNSVVVVPLNSICIVKVTGDYCRICIQSQIKDRVIVEGNGFSLKTSYF